MKEQSVAFRNEAELLVRVEVHVQYQKGRLGVFGALDAQSVELPLL